MENILLLQNLLRKKTFKPQKSPLRKMKRKSNSNSNTNSKRK